MKTRIPLCAVLFLVLTGQALAQRATSPPNKLDQMPKETSIEEAGFELRNPLPPIDTSVVAFLNNNTDGTYGFYLKKVGGPVVTAYRRNYAFYPASSIKVVEHLYVMREVSRDRTTLDRQINIWSEDDHCRNDHSGQTPERQETLSDTLRSMMKNSSNRHANAIQEEFGRVNMNRMAHGLIEMSEDSQLHHKFGCGGPDNDPANRLTLTDIGSLYEKVAQGSVLSESARETFYRMMRNETDSLFIESIIDSEADKMHLTAATKNSFKAKVKLAFKTGTFTRSGFNYRSVAGVVSLPFGGSCRIGAAGQIQMNSYVYGVFVDRARNVADTTVSAAASELFRNTIREALKSWTDCPRVGHGPVEIPR